MKFKLLRESAENFTVHGRGMSVVYIDVREDGKVSCFGKIFKKILRREEIGTEQENALTKHGGYAIITKITFFRRTPALWTAAIVRTVLDDAQFNMVTAVIAFSRHDCAHFGGTGMPFCISADF